MASYTLRIKKFLTNPLLERKQFAVEVLHPGRGTVPKAELKEKLAKIYRVADPSCIILFGFKTTFGGGHTSGFGVIYDNIVACKKFERRFRLARFGLAEAKPAGTIGRRGRKDIKNRQKKVRGIEKTKVAGTPGKKK